MSISSSAFEQNLGVELCRNGEAVGATGRLVAGGLARSQDAPQRRGLAFGCDDKEG